MISVLLYLMVIKEHAHHACATTTGRLLFLNMGIHATPRLAAVVDDANCNYPVPLSEGP
jgi:hypothetical protein